MATAQNQATRRIWYVGLKGDHPQGETAFSHLTGITWRAGDVHDIPGAVASQMLAHPDVFSDKSPEERAELERQAKERALQEQAQRQAAPAADLAAMFAALPAGTTVKLPDGRELTVSAPPGPAKVPGSLEGAHASPLAARLAAATGAHNEDGAPTSSLTGQVGDATGAADQVRETQVSGNTEADTGLSLAPGAVVTAAAPQATTKAAAPAAGKAKK